MKNTNHFLQSLLRHNALFVLLSLVIGLLAWEALARLSGLPPFILPTPLLVGQRFISAIAKNNLMEHAAVTLGEILGGLALGVGIATSLGYLIARSARLERLLAPYIVASQAVPVVAIAPLLIIWFGSGLLSKVLICALVVFFPVLVNTVVGIHSVPEDLRDLMRSLKATRLQTLRLLEIPAGLPVFLGGLRIGVTLSVIGAVVGEFAGSKSGLGFLINLARTLYYDTPLVYVAVLTLVGMALALYGLVVVLERRLTSWRGREW